MNRGRILVLLFSALICCPPAGAAAFSPSDGACVDPFLESFLVGRFQAADSIPMDGAWPRDLFAPAIVDSSRAEAWLRYFHGRSQNSRGMVCRRVLRSVFSSREESRRWLVARRDGIAVSLGRLAAGSGADPRVEAPPRLAALSAWKRGYYAAVELSASLAADAATRDGDEVGAFLMSLRRRAAVERLSAPAAPDTEGIWPELLELRAADAASGWSIWTAHRKALGAGALPSGCGGDRLARWLIGIPGVELDPAEVEAAGFSREARTALLLLRGGGLPRTGPRMKRFLAENPMPVEDPAFQWVWLVAGRDLDPRRREDFVAAAADAEEVFPANLGRLLALEADRDFGAGRREEALEWLGLGSGRGAGSHLAEQYLRGAAMSLAGGDTAAADGIAAAAVEGLAPADWEPYAARLELMTGAEPAPVGPAARAEAIVSAGRAAPAGGAGRDFVARNRAARQRAWDAWLAWGAVLAEENAGNDGLTRSEAEFLRGMAAASRAETPDARFGIGCDALGKWLAGSRHRDLVLEWCLVRDLERLAGGGSVAVKSPLPRLAAVDADTGNTGLRRLALCGFGLALGDGRVRIAATVGVDIPLPERRRLLLTHPLPADPDVVAAIAAAGVEPALALAVIRRESLFDPAARSRAGALGLMQVMPFHFPDRGFSGGVPLWRRPAAAVARGTSLLVESVRRSGGDPYRALAGYNAGPGAAERWRRQLGPSADGSHYLVWAGYPETRRYMRQVLIDRMIYDWILNGWPAES